MERDLMDAVLSTQLVDYDDNIYIYYSTDGYFQEITFIKIHNHAYE